MTKVHRIALRVQNPKATAVPLAAIVRQSDGTFKIIAPGTAEPGAIPLFAHSKLGIQVTLTEQKP